MTVGPEILPCIELKGNHEEIGFGHGRKLRERVQANYDFYTKTLFALPHFDFELYGKRFLEVVATCCPDYALEIEALARGAGMQNWQVMVLNARTEIFLQANEDLLKECTSLFFPQTAILGQNWDWMKPLEHLMVLLDIRQDHKPGILMMTEPGIIGKIGLNQAGIGVCLNILLGYKAITALPIHIILRLILECSTLEEVWQRLEKTPTGTYSHALVGDEQGRYLSLEFGYDQIHRVTYDHAVPLHTNHFLTHPYDRDSEQNPMMLDSHVREARGKQLREELETFDVAAMKRILLDDCNEKLSICKDYQPVWNVELATLCTLVMDLPERRLHLSKGNPRTNPFVTYQLAAKA